jgi:release factor glutamine methyltransferase
MSGQVGSGGASGGDDRGAGDGTSGDIGEKVSEAYRAGRWTFMGVDLLVAPGALVPRPETELLGRTAQGLLRKMIEPAGGQLQVIDMCCGSGNLACALAVGDDRLRIYAADLTDGCVGLSRKNVTHLGLDQRVTVHQGDLFAALTPLGLGTTIDLIVCNPPYISTARLGKDRAALLEREPIEAFDGGPYGLSIHQRVMKDAPLFLKPGGNLLFEIGLGQERQIKLLFDRARIYKDVQFVEDAEGRPRATVATLS